MASRIFLSFRKITIRTAVTTSKTNTVRLPLWKMPNKRTSPRIREYTFNFSEVARIINPISKNRAKVLGYPKNPAKRSATEKYPSKTAKKDNK